MMKKYHANEAKEERDEVIGNSEKVE